MNKILRVTSAINIEFLRYIRNFGIPAQQVFRVEMLLQSEDVDENDFIVSLYEAEDIFNRFFGDRWSDSILVERGVSVPPDLGKIVYVDFNPTIENIAIEIFNTLTPVFRERFDAILEKVTVFIPLGDSSYGLDSGIEPPIPPCPPYPPCPPKPSYPPCPKCKPTYKEYNSDYDYR